MTNPSLARMAGPHISVVIPVYNGVKYIREAISSVLEQEGVSVQLVVQDNASDDGTSEVLHELAAKDSRLVIKRNSRTVPMGENWNLAMDNATWEYLLLLSADDYLVPGALAVAMTAFKDDSVDVVTGNHFFLSSGHQYPRKVPVPTGVYSYFVDKLLAYNPFCINFTLFRRRAFEKLNTGFGLFKSYLLTCDFELWLRIAISGMRVGYLSTPLGVYRVHDENLSRKSGAMTRHTALSVFSHKRILREKWGGRYRIVVGRLILKVLLNAVRTGDLDHRLLAVLVRRSFS